MKVAAAGYVVAVLASVSTGQPSFSGSLPVDCPHVVGGTSLAEKPDETLSMLTEINQQAQAGNAQAKTCLAELYLLGWGVKADDAKAWALLHEAAEAGSARAMHRIGSIYELGTFLRMDRHKAFAWHLRAANLGYAPAQTDVGIFFEDGLVGERSIEEAVFWYRKGATQGEPFAMEALIRLDAAVGHKKGP